MTKRRSRTTRPPLERYRVPAGHHPTGHPTGRPTTVALAERTKPPSDERGSAGVVAWGGVLSGFDQDYADAWRLPRRWDTTERMRSDPAIAAALSALTYPVLAAKLKVEPASDDPEDVRLADFVDESLAGMTTSLARHRAEVLGFVGEGVRVFETVYERREDDYWRLRKLALRPNRTITIWHVDDTGGPDGVSQILADGRTEKLEMDRLLAFTHLGDGPSLLGRPATRAMYRPWFVIDKLSRIGAIALERHGVGIPWARYVGGSDTEAKRIDRALMGLHANEQSFFRVDDQVPEWGVKGVDGTVMDPVAFMEYQRRDLFLAPLAQFLALGTDGVGALSLSQDHSSFFMLALRFLVGEIDDTYNAYLVPRMIGYNWSVPADRLPRVQHGAIDQRSATDWATAVAQVVAAGITLPADDLTRTAARLLGLTVPEGPKQPAPAVADVNDPNAPEPGAVAGGAGRAAEQRDRGAWPGVDLAAGDGRLVSVVKMEALGIAPNFVNMSASLDKGRDRIIAKVKTLQEKQARRLAKIGLRLVKAGDAAMVARLLTGEADAVDLAAGKPRRLVAYDEEADAFAAEMYGLYDQGVDEYGNEIAQQGGATEDPGEERRGRDRSYIAALGLTAGALLADRMANAWAAEVMRQMRGGADGAALTERLLGLSGRLLEDLANQGANVALATGRAAMGEANAGIVEKEIYTAIIDGATCRGGPLQCLEQDGTEYPVGEGVPCPNPNCFGADRCRCLRVPVVAGVGR